MKKKFRLVLLLTIILTLFVHPARPYLAAEIITVVTENDELAIRRTITKQITALKTKDLDTAFSIASPSIRSLFRTPENFYRMVENGYSIIIDHVRMEFRDLQKINDFSLIQSVYFQRRSGESSLGLYVLQLQENGTWRINGCKLVPAPGETT